MGFIIKDNLTNTKKYDCFNFSFLYNNKKQNILNMFTFNDADKKTLAYQSICTEIWFYKSVTNYELPEGYKSLDAILVGGGEAGSYGRIWNEGASYSLHNIGGSGGAGGEVKYFNDIHINSRFINITIGGGSSSFGSSGGTTILSADDGAIQYSALGGLSSEPYSPTSPPTHIRGQLGGRAGETRGSRTYVHATNGTNGLPFFNGDTSVYFGGGGGGGGSVWYYSSYDKRAGAYMLYSVTANAGGKGLGSIGCGGNGSTKIAGINSHQYYIPDSETSPQYGNPGGVVIRLFPGSYRPSNADKMKIKRIEVR